LIITDLDIKSFLRCGKEGAYQMALAARATALEALFGQDLLTLW
jgi:hypothetical protein